MLSLTIEVVLVLFIGRKFSRIFVFIRFLVLFKELVLLSWWRW